MRIAFAPLVLSTHYFGLVPLAWAARAAGHDVRVVGQPAIIDAIVTSGLPAVSVGTDFDILAGVAESFQRTQHAVGKVSAKGIESMPTPQQLRQYRDFRFVPHVRCAQAMGDDLVAFGRSWRPDVVVADPLVLAAPLLSEAAGAPLVRHLWGPDIMRGASFPGYPLAEGCSPREDWPTELLALYDRLGVEPRAEHAVATVDPCPDSMQVPGIANRIPMRYVPYNGPGALPGWLLEPTTKPRVCITWGTVATTFLGPDGFRIPQILEGLAGQDLDIVVTVSRRDRALLDEVLPQLPPNVRAVSEMPLNLLLPTCDAVVHHGGVGAMFTAALYAVPQVIISKVTDHLFNSAALAATGAGIALRMDETDAAGIGDAVEFALTDDGLRKGARTLQEETLRRPAPSEVVGELEKIVTTGAGRH